MKTRFILLVLSLVSITSFAGSIAPEDAAKHIGEVATVVGKVDSVYVSKNSNAFLNMGGVYPKQAFTAFMSIKTAEIDLIANAKQYEGKNIAVTGKIQLYKGKPEIVVTRKGQIVVK